MRLVLASTSPARQALLGAAGFDFEAVDPGVAEALDGEAAAVAERLARLKAEAVARTHPDAVVVGADQVLSVGGRLDGKPADRTAARNQLRRLRGAMHDLVTGVAVAARGQIASAHHVARLTMHDLADAEIERYLDTGEWQGSAGAYRIEGRGILLFARVEGDFTAIRGLPMVHLGNLLRGVGFTVL